MNKNPFVPQPSYPQPPLPPGPPPPPQPGQSDYAAYWSGGSQPPPQQAAGPYNPAWGSQPAQTPQRPTPEQSALYANYGYSAQWQRQQQQQQLQQMQAQYHQAPPPPPVAQPPPPAAQPAYNPYQPAAGYPQAYVPQPMQAAPQPIPPPVYHPPQPQQQSFYHPPPQQQQMQQQQRHQIHHTPPQHLPPAKRQRFEGPNPTRMQHPPPQPQFQAPPPPQQNMGPFSGGQAQRGGAPGMSHMGAGRGGSQTGRGGASGGNRGGRGVATSGSRGNLSGGRGRGGSFSTGGGGMSGGRGGGSSSSLRAHGSRANFGDQNRRGGGGRSQYGYQSGSFRGGRGGGHAGSGRSGRHDGSGASAKDGHTSTGFVGKKEENRRTLTDFKIIGLEIKDLAWTWGITPEVASAPAAVKIESADEDGEKSMDHGSPQGLTEDAVKEEVKENDSPLQESRELSPIQESEPDVQQTQIDDSQVSIDDSQMTVNDGSQAPVLPPTQTLDAFSSLASVASVAAPPPARLRIYFHTPVNADDSRPIPYSSSTGGSGGGESTRKGKRKKLEDDDGDLEEGRSRPPPPQMHSQAQSIISDDRSDIAPSATSEGDWLMAAIAETEEDDHRHAELLTEHDQEEEEDADRLHVSQLVDPTEQDESADSDRVHTDGVADPAAPTDSKADAEDEVKGTDDVNMVAADKQPSDETSAPSPETESTEVKDANSAVDAHASSEGEKEAPKSPTPVAVASDSTILAAPEAPSASDSVASSEHSSVSAIFEPPPGAIPPSEITITESQVMGLVKSLLGASQPTLLNIDQPPKENGSVSPGVAPSDDGSVTVTNGPGVDQDHMDDQEEQSQVAEFHRHEMDHLPEPPASPQGSNTFLSNSSTSTYGGSPVALARAEQKTAGKTPSANRLSISFAGGGRRLVINAEVVESMKVYRQQGRIDVVLNLIKEEEDGLKGILLEHLSDVTKSYLPLENVLESSDGTLPPFSKMTLPGTMTLQVYLDKDKPLSEPKWVKTGDITEWLRTMFGRMFWVAGDAAEGWEKKIIVADPDPPPTIWTVLEGWASNSPVGTASERQRFLKTQMSELENVMEVLLRLVRGERATPSHQLNPTVSLTGLSGPLLSAMQGSEYGSQQTHVSLAVLAMFKMAIEYAEKALGTEEGKKEAEDKIGEIIRSLPSHLIYKSLDGIFKEWRVEKKGR